MNKYIFFLFPILFLLISCKQRSEFERDMSEVSRKQFESLELGQEFTAQINPKMGLKVVTTTLYTPPCKDTVEVAEIDDFKKAHISTTKCTPLTGTWYSAYADYNGVPIPVLLQVDCKEASFFVMAVQKDGVEVVIPVQTAIPSHNDVPNKQP